MQNVENLKVVKNFLDHELPFILRKASLSLNEEGMEGHAMCLNVLCELDSLKTLINLAFEGIKYEFTENFNFEDTK